MSTSFKKRVDNRHKKSPDFSGNDLCIFSHIDERKTVMSALFPVFAITDLLIKANICDAFRTGEKLQKLPRKALLDRFQQTFADTAPSEIRVNHQPPDLNNAVFLAATNRADYPPAFIGGFEDKPVAKIRFGFVKTLHKRGNSPAAYHLSFAFKRKQLQGVKLLDILFFGNFN